MINQTRLYIGTHPYVQCNVFWTINNRYPPPDKKEIHHTPSLKTQEPQTYDLVNHFNNLDRHFLLIIHLNHELSLPDRFQDEEKKGLMHFHHMITKDTPYPIIRDYELKVVIFTDFVL